MYRIEADVAQKILKLTFAQKVGPDDTKSCAEEVRMLLAEMPAGFRLLTDLSGLEFMDTSCASHLGQVMDLCNERGVEKVVRVIPDPHKDIGLKILSLFHYDRDVRIVTCASMEEANNALGP